MSYSTPSMTPSGAASGVAASAAGLASCTDSRQCAQRVRPSVERSSRSADMVSLRSAACSIIARARSGRANTRSRKSWPRSWRRSPTPPPITLSTVGLPLIRRPWRSSTKMPALVESKIWRYCASIASMSSRSSRSRGERLRVGAQQVVGRLHQRADLVVLVAARRARRAVVPGGIAASARASRTIGRETSRAPRGRRSSRSARPGPPSAAPSARPRGGRRAAAGRRRSRCASRRWSRWRRTATSAAGARRTRSRPPALAEAAPCSKRLAARRRCRPA